MKLTARQKIGINCFLIFSVCITILPFVWMALTSLKTFEESILVPPTIFPGVWQWENYKVVWEKFPFFNLYFNTFFTVIVVVFGQITISSLAAFAFARLQFPGKNVIFVLVLSLMMVPGQIFLVPHYEIMVKLGITDTLIALAIPSLFNVFGTFLLRQFFMTLPKELDEAALLDGCNYFQIYYKILLPQIKPALVSLAILTALWTWKDLMWPIIVNSSMDKMTLSSGLALLIGEHTTKYPLVMAGGIMAIWPMIILFMIFQKQFIEGVVSSGIKG